LTGQDRYYLYLTAVTTGFRANALANLTPGDFDLDAQTVTLPARFNKSRRLMIQPLPADVVAALRPYLAEKAAGRPIWEGIWGNSFRGAEMVRRDLEAAGIP
jgi:integrase